MFQFPGLVAATLLLCTPAACAEATPRGDATPVRRTARPEAATGRQTLPAQGLAVEPRLGAVKLLPVEDLRELGLEPPVGDAVLRRGGQTVPASDAAAPFLRQADRHPLLSVTRARWGCVGVP